MALDYSKISKYTSKVTALPKKITDVTDSIQKGAQSVEKMTSKMDAAVTKAQGKTKNPVSGAVVGGAKKVTGGINNLAQKAVGLANKVGTAGQAASGYIAAHTAAITKAANVIKQCESALKTTQAVIGTSSQLVNAVVNSATGHLHPRSNEKIFQAFDNQWDSWAATVNKIYEDLSPSHQANVLADLAKNNFGNNVFALGSAIKNESAGIFGGIADFEDALHSFRGSFRDPVAAAAKIEKGVKGIVNATERVANSINNMVKTWQGRDGAKATGNPALAYLGNLHDTKIVHALNATLTVANSAAPLVADGKALAGAIKSKNPLAIYGAAKTTVKDVKKVVKSVKDGATALQNMSGTPTGAAAPVTGGDISGGLGGNPGGATTSNPASSTPPEQTAPEQDDNDDSSGKTDSYVCSKAKIRCTYGDKISTLTVLPDRTIWLTGQPQANISDHRSMVNIAPFGKCRTTAYPPTAAATAAAHGKLTPMPCVPNTPFPWMNGKDDVILKGDPALLKTSKCKCIYGGTITITDDGQTQGAPPDLLKEPPINHQDI